MVRLCAWVTCTQFAARHLWVVGVVCHLLNRCHFHDFQQVELGCWVLFTLHNQNVLKALVVRATIQCLAVAHAVELKVFQRFDNRTWVERTGPLNSIRIEQGLHVAGVRRLAGWEAVFGAEGLDECFGAFVLQRPVPVCRTKDAFHVGTGTLRHQAGVQRNDDLEVFAVHLLVAQAELNRVGQRVHHVAAVVVQNQRVGTRLQNRCDVRGEVGLCQRRFHGCNSFPTHGFGRGFHRFFGGVAPVVIGGQVISLTVGAVVGRQNGGEGRAGHVGVEEVTETIGFFVFAGGVVGVGQTRHEDNACLLAKRLHGHSHTRGRAARDHHGAVFFDHRPGRGARGVRLGLCVACDIFDFLAQDTVACQLLGRECVHHAAVAATVQVLDCQLIGAQFVRTFIRVGAGLWYVEAQSDGAAGWRVGKSCVACRRQICRQREACTGHCASLQNAATRQVHFGHKYPPNC
mmetsp:Transcript_23278/g.40217  ORF Transcript_23278/g.40217 Transcript_23278/m.40217 type:complete len:459 (-) Transcript_23278:83-1459(-)